ncbi:hypothetical protein NEMBOFW57_008256 [Staphylotrichum longicolle]|uniref:NAD-dependent epimerase/dehydratase domain-containing protein n=1 Tax=Staphylotrichum longicolle TaxID=669026 RepID=A0AAD4HX09_9PEZI|nr:hypothetical protein NEMBOFW57_008256 [Staphylotrichum longicolle]
MTSDTKILLTGATGFIGGSVLTSLLDSSASSHPLGPITCLMRGPDRASLLSSTYGDRVNLVLYQGLDDLEATTAVAAQHDIVINTTLGYHSPSTKALLRGLAQRKASTGRDVWMIHTSGTSNVGDKPITKPGPVREFDDSADDVYAYEKEQEALEPYAQRTTELGVIDTGLQLGVKTIVIMSPIIYGNGTGLFNKVSIHTMYMKAMMQIGHAVVVGDGAGVWDHVHVQDLAELYRLVVLEILEKEGRDLPTGKKGIIFSGNGRHSWLEYSQLVADALYDEGVITQKTVAPLSLEEAGTILMPHLGFINDETTKEG